MRGATPPPPENATAINAINAINAAKEKGPGSCGGAGAKEKVRAALLSHALERTIIAAGGLNGRVRDGNGCLTPANGTNQKGRRPAFGELPSRGTWPPGPCRPPPDALAGKGGRTASRPHDLSEAVCSTPRGAYTSALSTGGLPVVFRGLRPGRIISGEAWRLDAFSAYPVATWLPGGADGSTTGTPEVARPRSSRTRGRSRQPSCACGGYGPNCLTTF